MPKVDGPQPRIVMEIERLIPPDAPVATKPFTAWTGKWIWTADPTEGEGDFVYFRREFELSSVPPAAVLRSAADREYALWVNGCFVGRGLISDPRFKRYDTRDVSALLRRGKNCIAALVYHDISIHRWTVCPEAHGFLCQLEAGQFTLVSDEAWAARRSEAYLAGVRFDDTTMAEIYDSRQAPAGWEQIGFDDAQWPRAVAVIARVHRLFRAKRPQARFFPWIHLVPADVAEHAYKRRLPVRVVQCGEVLQRREASPQDVAVRLSLEQVQPCEKAKVEHVEALLENGASAVLVCNSDPNESGDTFDGLRNATVVLDFGQLMNARLGFRLKAPAGARIDIGYSYRLEDGRVIPYVSLRTPMADQYTTREGEQEWQTFQWRHCRYVQLTFRDLHGEIELFNVWAEEVRNPFAERGEFVCCDPLLNQAFVMSRRTADLCVVDHTMDNASRERRQHGGDCSGILRVFWACFGDVAVGRKYFVQHMEGQHGTGIHRGAYPGVEEAEESLMGHTLSFVLRLYEHYMLYADADLVARLWLGIERLVEMCCSFLDEEGLMPLPPYGIFFDWADLQREDYPFILNAWCCEVLRRAAVLGEAVGRTTQVARWRAAARLLAEGLRERWWNEERGVFSDCLIDAKASEHISEHANSLAIIFGIATSAQTQRIMDAYSKDRAAFGAASPGWIHLPEAFIRAGRVDLAIDWIHRHFSRLIAMGLETVPEVWTLYGEQTPGTWRCRNSRAVAQGAGLGVPWALLTELCGIQPLKPGFQTVRFAPQPGPLESFRGSFPGPDGEYSLAYEKRNGESVVEIALPREKPVVLDLPFAAAGAIFAVNGRRLKPDETIEMPNGAPTPRFHLRGRREYQIGIIET